MDYTHSSTEALLASLIGEEATCKCYRGALRSLFEGDTGYDDVAPLFVARELVYRWLAEDLAVRDALSSPDIVRNFLRLDFLYQQAVHHHTLPDPWSTRAAVTSLLSRNAGADVGVSAGDREAGTPVGSCGGDLRPQSPKWCCGAEQSR